MNEPTRHDSGGKSAGQMRMRGDNRRMLGKLAVITFMMFGFGYALVPLYEAVCDALGINVLSLSERKATGAGTGTAANTQIDLSRTITIEFDAKGDRKDAEMTIFTMKTGKIVPIAIVKGGVTTKFEEFMKAAQAAEGSKDPAK